MVSFSTVLFGSPPVRSHYKVQKPLIPISNPIYLHPNPLLTFLPPRTHVTQLISSSNSHLPPTKPHTGSEPLSLPPTSGRTITLTAIAASTALSTLPCFAFETASSSAEQFPSDKISLEAILVSIDEFFGRYPFFVAGCTFIWLIVIPISQYYLSKCKYIYSIDVFKKLRDDPNAQLLDIRDVKSLKYLKSPNLKLLGKSVVQVQYSEDDTDGFVKKVLENFPDPENTVICILDSIDGNSMSAAELLFKKGFKEAYAIKGGVAGNKGWLQIQEKLLPPSLHMRPRKKNKKSKKLGNDNGAVTHASDENTVTGEIQEIDSGEKADMRETESKVDQKVSAISSSPYPNYPDLKPPSSPMPSKPSK